MSKKTDKEVAATLKAANDKRDERKQTTLHIYAVRIRGEKYGVPFISQNDALAVGSICAIAASQPKLQGAQVWRIADYCGVDDKVTSYPPVLCPYIDPEKKETKNG